MAAGSVARRFTWISTSRPEADLPPVPLEHLPLLRGLAQAINGARDAGWSTVWYVVSETSTPTQRAVQEAALGPLILLGMELAAGVTIEGVTMYRLTDEEITAWHGESVLLLVYPDVQTLHRVDEVRKPHGVVVVPWDAPPVTWGIRWGATYL